MSQESPLHTVRDVAELLRREDRILVVSHMRPDGDCYGSATALMGGLLTLGKVCAAYNVSGVPKRLSFLPFIDKISDRMPEWTPSVTVFVDCGDTDRVEPDFKPKGKVINIDHHATNSRFGDLNYIDVETTSVGEQIYYLLKELGVKIDKDIATGIYTSLSDDSGNFRYPNTSSRTFEIAAELVALGVKPSEVSQHLYESKSRQEVDLIGRVLSRIQYGADGKFAWSEIRWQDYVDVGGPEHEPDGMSSEIRGIEGVEAAILFHEQEDGSLRGSARGRGEVDCAAIAENFGGGGHFNAAGFRISGEDYEKARDRAVEFVTDSVAKTFG